MRNSVNSRIAGLLLLAASSLLGPGEDARAAEARLLSSALGTTSTTEEEELFDAMVEKLKPTKVPKNFKANDCFVMNFPKKLIVKPEVVETPVETTPVASEPVPIDFDPNQVKLMFAGVRVSSISITPSLRMAVISYNNSSLRIHKDETVLGLVKVVEIEKDRVLFQPKDVPAAIWVYRVRPGMPAPLVIPASVDATKKAEVAAQ